MNRNSVLLWFGYILINVYIERVNTGRNSTDDEFRATFTSGSTLTIQHSRRYIQYKFDSEAQEAEAIRNGDYNFTQNLPIDLQAAPDGRIFIAILRDIGVPASLTIATDEPGQAGSYLLRAYPDWSWTNTSDCNNIVAAYRMALDKCNRLWVLDHGTVAYEKVCPAKLLAFDLAEDTLVQRVEIPDDAATNSNGVGWLDDIVINPTDGNCTMMDIYISDGLGFGLIHWNGTDFRRFESQYFSPDREAGLFDVAGTVVTPVLTGIYGMAITREEPNPRDRVLYYRPLSSFKMFHMNVSELLTKKNDQSSIEIVTEPTETKSQSIVQAFSSRDILFFSGTSEMSILCWNRNKAFVPQNIVTVAQNNETLQWATSIKVYQGEDSEVLWVLTNRMQDYATNKMDFTQINFRMLSANVDDLVRGTNCE